jgi:hypothetical protein
MGLSRPVDSAELTRLTLQAGAVHEICGMKSCAEREAAWRRGFVESWQLSGHI